MKTPNKSLKIYVLSLACFLFVIQGPLRARVNAYAFGPPYGHTGGAGEDTCVICHASFPLNSGPGSIRITGLPANYGLGQVVPVSVTVYHPEGSLYGFQLTVLDSAGESAGRLVASDVTNTQLVSGTVGQNFRTYVEHTFPGTFPVEFDLRRFTFTWIAPESNPGPVTFYAAGNGADGNGGPGGDFIYTTSAAVQDNGLGDDCAYYTSPAFQSFSANGGSGTINVIASPRCSWQAMSSVNWITVKSSGIIFGDGTVSYSVGANTGTRGRRGIISIAGKNVVVKQKRSVFGPMGGLPRETIVSRRLPLGRVKFRTLTRRAPPVHARAHLLLEGFLNDLTSARDDATFTNLSIRLRKGLIYRDRYLCNTHT